MQYPDPGDRIVDRSKWAYVEKQLPGLVVDDPSKDALPKRQIRALAAKAKPKAPPTTAKEKKALIAKWDAILAAEGFQDIETPPNGFGERGSPFLRRHSQHTIDAITKGTNYNVDLLRAYDDSKARRIGKVEAPTAFERDCLSLYLRGWREKEIGKLLTVHTDWVHAALKALTVRAKAFAKKHLSATLEEDTFFDPDDLSTQVAREFHDAQNHKNNVITAFKPTNVDEYDEEFTSTDHTPWEHFFDESKLPKPTKRKPGKGKG